MPGYKESVFNVGDPESYVTGNDKLAAQQGDFLMRQRLMQQNAAALQAQLQDSQANRDMQLQLQGTAADRYGHEDKFQAASLASAKDLNDSQQAGSTMRTSMTMGPATSDALIRAQLFKEGGNLRDAESGARMDDIRRNKMIDDQVYGSLGFGGQGGAAPSAPASPPNQYTALVGQGNETAGAGRGVGGGLTDPKNLRSLQVLSALRNHSALPNFALEDAQLNALQTRTKIDQEGEADREMQRQIEQAKNKGDYATASTLQKTSGVKANYDDPATALDTNPELFAAYRAAVDESQAGGGFGGFARAIGSLPDRFARGVDNLVTGGKSYDGGWDTNQETANANVEQQTSAAIQQLLAQAKKSNVDPKAMLAYIMKEIRPQLGNKYIAPSAQ